MCLSSLLFSSVLQRNHVIETFSWKKVQFKSPTDGAKGCPKIVAKYIKTLIRLFHLDKKRNIKWQSESNKIV